MNDVYKPASLKDAVTYLSENTADILSGGTDYMVRNRHGAGLPVKGKNPVLYIGALEELKEIFIDDEKIEIGAGVNYSTLLREDMIPRLLRDAIKEIASPSIRNLGTLGGNICNASPAGDSLPPLYVLDANVKLMGLNRMRNLPVDEFITGPGRTILEKDELLVSVFFKPEKFQKAVFKKIGTRKSNALAKASFCAVANREGEKLTEIRIAFGAVAPIVVRRRDIERDLTGKNREEIISEVDYYIAEYGKYIKPIDDQRSTAEYRKGVVLNLLRKFLTVDIWV